MKIKFWGVRGSIPAPGPETVKYGGNSSCLEVRLSDDTLIILDAGTGIRKLGLSLLAQKKKIEAYLLLSHGHMDHVHGFPFFGPAYIRGNTFFVSTCTEFGEPLDVILGGQMRDIYFPVGFDGLKAEINLTTRKETDFTIGAAKVTSIPINHPGGGSCYKIEEGGESFVYLTDNELASEAKGAIPFEEYVKFCQGVDLLVHDAQYTPEEYERTRGWGHSRYTDTIRLSMEARVKRLALFHHDPERNDKEIEQLVKKCITEVKKSKIKMQVFAAAEGKEVSFS